MSFALSEPFSIDHGELDGLTPEQCFVFGVEWAFITGRLESNPREFVATIHQQNAPRLRDACRRRGRSCTVKTTDAVWAELSVGARGAN